MKIPEIIADIGANHRGNWTTALKQVDAAKKVGVTTIKFQLFTTKELYGYGSDDDFSFPPDWLEPLALHARAQGLDFMCTAFSPEGVRLIDPWVRTHKVASSEMVHLGILEAIKETGKPFILSTGGAHFSEVMSVCEQYQPACVLECVSNYPANPVDYSPRAMAEWLKYGSRVGVSDHTIGETVALVSIGFGATVFEKHFDAFPEHGSTADTGVSALPGEFALYVTSIREAFQMLTNAEKQPRNQHDMATKWRRRLVAIKDIQPGERLSYGDNYGIFRVRDADAKGANAMQWASLDHKVMRVAKAQGEGISLSEVQ